MFPLHRTERKLWRQRFPFELLFFAIFCPLFVLGFRKDSAKKRKEIISMNQRFHGKTAIISSYTFFQLTIIFKKTKCPIKVLF